MAAAKLHLARRVTRALCGAQYFLRGASRVRNTAEPGTPYFDLDFDLDL